MLRALRLNFGRARSSPSRLTNSPFRRWITVLYVSVLLLLVLNYLVIFQWTYFSELSRQIWPDASFHPVPHGYAHTTNPSQQPGNGPDYWLWNTETRFRTHKNTPLYNLSSEDANDDCANFPHHMLKDIQVTLKVGKADNADRTDAQLSSVIKCIPNVLIASDQSHLYGPNRKSTNVLAPLPPETYLTEEDLEIYNRQKSTKGEDLHQGVEGWKLDKYKFLAEVEEAVKKNPKAEWYVFLESDTYIFWDNMFRLLDGYDSTLPYYFGSPSPGRTVPPSELNPAEKKVWFGYGGTGFVLSGIAAHRLVDRRRNALAIKGPRVTEEYKEDVRNDCCGDSMLGWALYDKAGVELSGLWPMFNPHPLHGVPFGKYYWCEPVLSLHKTHPEDFQKLWKWELKWDKEKVGLVSVSGHTTLKKKKQAKVFPRRILTLLYLSQHISLRPSILTALRHP